MRAAVVAILVLGCVGCGGAVAPEPPDASPSADIDAGAWRQSCEPGGPLASCRSSGKLAIMPVAACGERECDEGDSPCARCPGASTCIAGACFESFGPKLPTYSSLLMRSAGGGGEGQRFTVERRGVLAYVSAAIWGHGTIRVQLRCDGELRDIASTLRPIDRVPFYDGIRSPMQMTRFRLDPPLRVEAGDEVVVWVAASVAGIHMSDMEPGSKIQFCGTPLGIESTVNWDMIVQLHLHD